MDFVWIRTHNLFYLVWSTIFLVYPFDFRAVLDNWQFSLPGAVGLVMIYPPWPNARNWQIHARGFGTGYLGPFLLILAIYPVAPRCSSCTFINPCLGVLLFFGVSVALSALHPNNLRRPCCPSNPLEISWYWFWPAG